MANNTNSIGAIIDRTRHLVRQTHNDSTMEDELLYAILNDSRLLLMYRELNKHRLRSKLLYKTVCMPLEKSSDIPCDCIPDRVGCVVLKSKFPLPKPIRTHTYELISVTSLDGKTEYSYKETRVGKFNQYSRLGLKPYYTVYNRYLYIIGIPGNNLAGVLVSLIPEDPTDFDQITFCDATTGDETTCFNPLIDSFNVDGHLVDEMISMTLQKLIGTIQIPEPVSNDANPAPPQLQY